MINILQGDCMDLMAGKEDNYYDLAIVDPPYGIGNFHPEGDSGSYKKGTKKLKTSFDNQGYKWNESTPGHNYFDELKRVSNRQIIWGANYYNAFSDLGGCLVWYKNTGLTTQLSQCELASLSWKKQVDYVSITKLTGFVAPIKYIHPCEKPVALYKWLLKNYAKEGDKILDTHGGSMSSAIACHDYKYDLDIIELDKDYYEAGKKRFDNHVKQLSLF